MELDVELNWDHVAIGLLNEHGRLIVDDVGLTGLVVATHELRVSVLYQLRHEALDPVIFGIVLAPPKEQP